MEPSVLPTLESLKGTRLAPCLALLMLATTSLGLASASTRKTLALVPGYSIPWVSNLVTSSFIEASFPAALLDVVGIIAILCILEPIYSRSCLVKLALFSALSSGVVCFLANFTLFYATRQSSYLFAERCSFLGVLGSFVMALARCKSPALEAQKHDASLFLPGAYLLLCSAWSATLGPLDAILFAVPGTFAGWFYLQYVARELTVEPNGQLLVSLWPLALAPSLFAPPLTALERACGLSLPTGATDGTNVAKAMEEGLPATSNADAAAAPAATSLEAARRRELGQQALEARLAAAAGSAGASPSSAGSSAAPRTAA